MIASAPPDPAAAATFAAFAVALWAKGLALSAVQVRARVHARAFARPEDAAMLRLSPAPEPAVAARAGDAWRNETENGPFALALAAAAVLVGAPWPALAFACGAFVIARLLHARAALDAAQPLRTLAWLAGQAAMAGLAGLSLAMVGSRLS
jgi:uncharacterized MAPEG superfamily protein